MRTTSFERAQGEDEDRETRTGACTRQPDTNRIRPLPPNYQSIKCQYVAGDANVCPVSRVGQTPGDDDH